MRTARGKGNDARKLLSYYRLNFGLNPPYQVLCDGPTIHHSLQQSLYLKETLPSLLGATAYPVVTECVVKELSRLGDSFSNAALFAKRATRIPCAHPSIVPAAECIISVVKAGRVNVLLATNDAHILTQVLSVPGVPLLTVSAGKKIVLATPSRATIQFVHRSQRAKLRTLSSGDHQILEQLQQKEQSAKEGRVVRKRKRPKEPNPLSVKKSKKTPSSLSHDSKPVNVKQTERQHGLIADVEGGGDEMRNEQRKRDLNSDKLLEQNMDNVGADAAVTKKRRRRKKTSGHVSDAVPFAESKENAEVEHTDTMAQCPKSQQIENVVKVDKPKLTEVNSREQDPTTNAQDNAAIEEDQVLEEKKNYATSRIDVESKNDKTDHVQAAEDKPPTQVLEPDKRIQLDAPGPALPNKASVTIPRAAKQQSIGSEQVVTDDDMDGGGANCTATETVRKKKHRKNRRRRPKKALTD